MDSSIDSAISPVPSILLDRVLTAVVFALMIHYGLFYSLQLLFDCYHIFFRFDFPQLGFWRLIKHPFQFVVTTVMSLGWIYLCVGVGCLTWISYRRLQWIKAYRKKRDWKLRLSNFSYGIAYYFIGMLLASTYLRFMNRKNYDPSSSGVDQRYSFVLQSCGIVSTYFYINFLSTYDYLMKFPLIETSALLRLRGIVLPVLKEAGRLSVHVTLLSYFVNLIAGDFFHTLICIFTTGGLNISENGQLSSITNYFDLELLFVVVLSQLLVAFTLKSLWLTMEAIITKRVKFRIGDQVPGVSSIGLREMLVSKNAYLKKLAYYDLKLLTEYDENRMLNLFTLSHPGGFPKVWSTVSRACLDQIQKLTNDLTSYLNAADDERKKKETASLDKITQGLVGPRANFMTSSNELGTGVKLRSRFGVTTMRNLHLQNGADMKHVEDGRNGFYAEFFGNPFAPVINMVKSVYELVSNYAWKFLSVLNLLKYFKESSETDVASLFADQETTVWAINALADVVVASTKIDSKGVVQPDICTILTSLIDLSNALDDLRALKDGGRAELFPRGSDLKLLVPRSSVRALIQDVRKPLKNEIIRIHLKFHNFYDIINLPPSYEHKLQQLMYWD